jgi:hypothetical protein
MDPDEPSPASPPHAARSHHNWRSTIMAVLLIAAVVIVYSGTVYRLVWLPTVIRAFHQAYYNSPASTWLNTRWQGVSVEKNPLDLWIFQEIIYDTKPDVIVEAGTFRGGSALFMANMLDLLGHGQVVTIDIEEFPDRPQNPRIHYLLGDCGEGEEFPHATGPGHGGARFGSPHAACAQRIAHL